MNNSTPSARLAFALLCIAPLAGNPALAQEQYAAGTPYATTKTCDGTPEPELRRRAEAGDYRAAHVLGLRYFADPYATDRGAKARPYLAQGAAQHYPPSLYWYAVTGGGGSNAGRYALISEAAERGYLRALLDKAIYYAVEKSPYYDRATAYAWLTVCHRYGPSCNGERYEEYVPGLTDKEKERGEAIAREIVARRSAYPQFVEVSNCAGEAMAPRE